MKNTAYYDYVIQKNRHHQKMRSIINIFAQITHEELNGIRKVIIIGSIGSYTRAGIKKDNRKKRNQQSILKTFLFPDHYRAKNTC